MAAHGIREKLPRIAIVAPSFPVGKMLPRERLTRFFVRFSTNSVAWDMSRGRVF